MLQKHLEQLETLRQWEYVYDEEIIQIQNFKLKIDMINEQANYQEGNTDEKIARNRLVEKVYYRCVNLYLGCSVGFCPRHSNCILLVYVMMKFT